MPHKYIHNCGLYNIVCVTKVSITQKTIIFQVRMRECYYGGGAPGKKCPNSPDEIEDCNTEACKDGEERKQLAKSPQEILKAMEAMKGHIHDLQSELFKAMRLGSFFNDKIMYGLAAVGVILVFAGVTFLCICKRRQTTTDQQHEEEKEMDVEKQPEFSEKNRTCSD